MTTILSLLRDARATGQHDAALDALLQFGYDRDRAWRACRPYPVLKCVEIFESYVGKGAPSNASGARRGYGLTKKQAHENAGHFANQAPWARVRKITVIDQAKRPMMTAADELVAWQICGTPDEFVPATERERVCAYLIGQGRFASAILKALSDGSS